MMNSYETKRQQYYNHTNYTATYYALYMALEAWLSKVVFREDISRVFLASSNYAYRRRFELTDPSTNFDDIKVASLNFPFANYWPLNSGWVPEDRVAANPAAMIEKGISVGGTILKAMMVTEDVDILLHFDREDDARLAYEKLLWQSYRERLSYTSISWRSEILDIPLNISVKNLAFSPKTTEEDWLKENRIFVIECTVGLRSFVLEPPAQASYLYDDNPVINDYETFSMTEEVISSIATRKGVFSKLHVKSLLNYNPSISINYLKTFEETNSSFGIMWDVNADLSSIDIDVNGKYFASLPGDAKSYIFRGLIKGSEYRATITFVSSDGVTKVASLLTHTIDDSSVENVSASENSLVGTTW